MSKNLTNKQKNNNAPKGLPPGFEHLTYDRFMRGRAITAERNYNRFGDARDHYLRFKGTEEAVSNPCTSKGLSTMPRRQR